MNCGKTNINVKKSLIIGLLASSFIIVFPSIPKAEENLSRGIEIINQQGQQVGLYKESHALVIGVSRYTNGWPNLPGVREDIANVRTALEKQGFKVETAEDPDREELRKVFDGFINRYGLEPNNRLLFYFTGHGYTRKQSYGEEMGYVVPVDAPNPNRDPAGFLTKALDMQQIEVYAKRIQSNHALFIFDSCFSGSIFALSRAIPENISYKTSKPVRQFITSGSAEEQVPDKSIFCHQFIAALNGEGDVDEDGYITGTELGEFLQKKVVNYSRGAQHPQYGKIRNPNLDEGDFVFKVASLSPELPSAKSLPKPLKSSHPIDDRQSRLEEREDTEVTWHEWQGHMEQAFRRATVFQERPLVPPYQKIVAWKRFLRVFAADNPFSKEDNLLRKEAHIHIAYWRKRRKRLPVRNGRIRKRKIRDRLIRRHILK